MKQCRCSCPSVLQGAVVIEGKADGPPGRFDDEFGCERLACPRRPGLLEAALVVDPPPTEPQVRAIGVGKEPEEKRQVVLNDLSERDAAERALHGGISLEA